MFDWLNVFMDPAFMPHGHCYLWRPDILWVHVISDAVIALAYYIIPTLLAFLVIKREKSIPYPELFWLFSAFIFFCGTTHLISIYVTWVPSYVLQAWVKAATAVVSIITAGVLLPKLPQIIAIPGIQKALAESESQVRDLEVQLEEIRPLHDAALGREERVSELKKEVNTLLAELNRANKYRVD